MSTDKPEPQATQSQTALKLILLGRPRLSLAGNDVTDQIKYRKGIALLGYLATYAGTWFTRETLADLLWPDLDLAAARTNLRQVLNNLGTLLNRSGDILLKDGAAVAIAPDAGMTMDIELLSDSALARVSADTPAARLWREREIEPWAAEPGGEFMAGLQLSNTPEFGAWLEMQRLRFQERTFLLLEKLCLAQHGEGRLATAVGTARRLVGLSPLNENHTLLLMSLLAEAGDPRGALEACGNIGRCLAAELGVAPGHALLTLRDELIRRVEAASGQSRLGNVGEPELRQLVALYCVSDRIESDEEDEDFTEHFKSVVRQWGGEAVSALGRGLLAVFGAGNSAERATQRAVLAARDLLPDAAGGLAAPRIGISAGRVLLRPSADMPYLAGDMPDIAKLLGWSAQPGEILVSEAVALRTGEWFRFALQDERSLPGIEGRHKIYRLAGRLDPASQDGMPLAGRDRELAQLAAWWDEAAAGRPRVVILRAPAGFGKTRLAAALAQQVAAKGGHVRRIQCRLEHQHEPLAPVLAEFGTTRNGEEARSKSALFAEVIARLNAEAEDTPTLLVIDDLHWSDRTTRALLVQLGHGLEAQRLLLVVTTRPEIEFDLPAGLGEGIELPTLDEGASLSMIGAHDTANAIAPDERAHIAAICAGIPLFIERQVKSRIEGGHHQFSITGLLQGELDRLGADKPVLQAAALLGNRFQRKHLAALLPNADVAAALTRAIDRQLIDAASAGSYAFRHALIQDAAYEYLPLTRRRQLHERAARLFTAEPEIPAEEVAQHFTAAGCRDEAVVWWLKAGEAGMAGEFAADAMVSFQKALDQLESAGPAADPALVRTVRMRLGYAAQVAEGYGSRLTYRLFADMAAEIEAAPDYDPGQLFSALSGCYMGGSSFDRDEGLRIARRLQVLAHDDAERLMAYFALGNTLFWLGHFREAAHWQRQCIELAAEVPLVDRIRYGVDDPQLTSRSFHSWTLWFLGEDGQACAMADEALALARKGGRAHGLCFVLIFAACLHWCRGDTAKVAAFAGEALTLAKQYAFPLWQGGASLLLLWAQASSGGMTDSSALFGAAAMLQQALPSRVTTSRWIVLHGLLARSEWQEMEKLLDVSLREIEFLEEQYCLADLLWLKGRCLERRGEDDAARLHYRKARNLAARQEALGLSVRFV
jgi:DNA-binding SARP family transcriptional activator/tetratricopeptide (TPR) repeat protein